jgi:Tfp pilus assembly protein PilF
MLGETPALYANRAIARMRRGLWEEAMDDCRQVLRLDPQHAKAHARMGRCYFELGQLVEADKAYNRAAEIDPNLKELQSRWRLDSALNKIAKAKDPPALLKVTQIGEDLLITHLFAQAKQQSKSGFAAPIPEENDPKAREMWEMWTSACKANPVFLRAGEREDESVALALMLKPRVTSEEVRQDAQRAYDAGDLIINRNEGLSWRIQAFALTFFCFSRVDVGVQACVAVHGGSAQLAADSAGCDEKDGLSVERARVAHVFRGVV